MTKELALQVIDIMNESRSDSTGSMSDIYNRYQAKMSKLFGRSLSDNELSDIELEAINTSEGANDSPLGSLEMAIARLQLNGHEGFSVLSKDVATPVAEDADDGEIEKPMSIYISEEVAKDFNGPMMFKYPEVSLEPNQEIIDVDQKSDPSFNEMKKAEHTKLANLRAKGNAAIQGVGPKVTYIPDNTSYPDLDGKTQSEILRSTEDAAKPMLGEVYPSGSLIADVHLQPSSKQGKVTAGKSHRAGFTSTYLYHAIVDVIVLVVAALIYKGNFITAIVVGLVLAFVDKVVMETVISKCADYMLSKSAKTNSQPSSFSVLVMSILAFSVTMLVTTLGVTIVQIGGVYSLATMFVVPLILVELCTIGSYVNFDKYKTE